MRLPSINRSRDFVRAATRCGPSSCCFGHPDFSLVNPNRLRALIGAFGAEPAHAPRQERRGLPLSRQFDPRGRQAQSAERGEAGRRPWAGGAASREDRAELMRAELERILAAPGLSKDVFEQVSKSLA